MAGCENWSAPVHPPSKHFSLFTRETLSTENTINVIFGILAVFLGVLSVAFAWAMCLLQKMVIRQRHGPVEPVLDDELELQRIARDHHGNYVTL